MFTNQLVMLLVILLSNIKVMVIEIDQYQLLDTLIILENILRKLINDKKKNGEWKIQLIMKVNFISSRDFIESRDMYSKSDNFEIMIGGG